MKRHIFLMCFLTAMIATAIAQEKARVMESLSMKSTILNQDLKYSVILPPGYYEGSKRYPVVYLLHGLGDNEFSWLEYGSVSQLADQMVAKKEITPMIFVMPQGFRSYYANDQAGTYRYEDMFIRELIPFIDKTYRTKDDAAHRATMGYSMGGFGALMLPARNPEVIGTAVPLSISVRTDEQYKTEDANGWDEQWGRLFGGIGKTGADRLTDYYKSYSPFYVFAQNDISKLKNLRIYIDNGDDEGTLSRSNEELHMLLRERGVAHEFRVRNGGHEFSYWRDAMPNGLRFISDAFDAKTYRGDVNMIAATRTTKPKTNTIKKSNYSVVLPAEFPVTTRSYPAIYFLGDFTQAGIDQIAGKIETKTASGEFPPMILVFASATESHLLDQITPQIEASYRARPGFRFRSLIGIGNGGATALNMVTLPEQFTSCAAIDATPDCALFQRVIADKGKKTFSRTWFFVTAPDKGVAFQSNGCLHTTFRDADVYHEYRVSEGAGGMAWALDHLDEALKFTEQKIHH